MPWSRPERFPGAPFRWLLRLAAPLRTQRQSGSSRVSVQAATVRCDASVRFGPFAPVDFQMCFPRLTCLFASVLGGTHADEAQAESGSGKRFFQLLRALGKHMER